jgi:predicted house-cleaning noncanonical NTP pyrophosphatase (MazG superfamily)
MGGQYICEWIRMSVQDDPGLRPEAICRVRLAGMSAEPHRDPASAPGPVPDRDGRPEKLVRDRIPEIIRRSGRRPQVRVAADDEYVALLRAKLYEEAGEYVSSHDPEELADLLEVIRALGSAHGVEPAELEELRAAKAAERGGFAGRLVLRLPEPPPAENGPVRRHSVRPIRAEDATTSSGCP